MNPALAMPEAAPPRRRGRIQLLLILMVVIGPMMLATAMYKFSFWVPEGRSYHGTLIGNGQTDADIGVQGAAPGGGYFFAERVAASLATTSRLRCPGRWSSYRFKTRSMPSRM